MTDTQKLFRIYADDRAVRAMAVVAAVGVALAASRGSLSALWLFVLGWSLYVLEEYLIHRFIFHAPAPRQQFLFDLLYRLHYGHHDQVRNKHLLFTPLWFALPMSLLTVGILWLVLPFSDALIAVLGGGVCAYLAFEWLHLTSHFRMTKGRLGRYITRRHARHHNVDHNHWYTVSPGGQLVDSAFGSDPAEYSVVPNVQTCGLDPDDPRLARSRLRFGFDASLLNTSPAPVRAAAGQAV